MHEINAVAKEEHHFAAGLLHRQVRIELYDVLAVLSFKQLLHQGVVVSLIARAVGGSDQTAHARGFSGTVDIAAEEVYDEEFRWMLLKEVYHVGNSCRKRLFCLGQTMVAIERIAVEAWTQVDAAYAAIHLLAHRHGLGGRRCRTVGHARNPVVFAGGEIVGAGNGYVGHKHVIGEVGHPVGGLVGGGGLQSAGAGPGLVPCYPQVCVGVVGIAPGVVGVAKRWRCHGHCNQWKVKSFHFRQLLDFSVKDIIIY